MTQHNTHHTMIAILQRLYQLLNITPQQYYKFHICAKEPNNLHAYTEHTD